MSRLSKLVCICKLGIGIVKKKTKYISLFRKKIPRLFQHDGLKAIDMTKPGSQHNDVVLAFNYKSFPAFRLINMSNTTCDVKDCPGLVQPRVTTRRQDADGIA